ncbi:hypothetical protein WM40_07165 [Robbsia andropogonis]|uniref:Uncharacterized protein n=1 Tax=Robbsia andropogonis TaxID=28092 RepID=A0A0F5K311_9BURK|nr:hypothetical protein WM40_07165 [Robbsia andropogonis]
MTASRLLALVRDDDLTGSRRGHSRVASSAAMACELGELSPHGFDPTDNPDIASLRVSLDVRETAAFYVDVEGINCD